MIPIILQKNMTVEAAKPLDAKYFNTSNTPYTTTSEVLSQIPVGYRHTGLTVLVVDTEYWFDASGNLVLKDNDTGLMDYRGAYNASSNTYPTTGGSGTGGAIMKADVFVISVAGTLGGVAIQVGDYLIANTDTPAQTSSKWDTLNTNISYVPEDIANKVTSVSGSSTNTQYPTAKLLYDQLALKQANISLTTTGSSGASTFVSNTLNVPTYTLSGLGGVASSRQLTINGTTYDLSADRTWSVGTVTSVTATSPIASSGGVTPNITIQQASGSQSGYLSATDWTTFNSKQNAISPAALTKTNDTNVTLTLGGSPTTALLAATSLTLGWTGTLADSRIASASTWNAKQNALGFTPENVANKVTSVSSASTDTQYPTAKLLFDSLGGGGVGGYVYWALGNEPVGGGSVNVPLYGMLYNWYAATDSRNIANSGWHVPSNVEMTNLRIFLDPAGSAYPNTAGGAMKATGTTYWLTPNTGATNSSNLGVRGAGERATIFSGFNTNTGFWNTWSASTGDGGTGLLFHDNATFFTGLDISTNKFAGLSIILRKDTPTVGANYTIVPNGYTGNDGNVYNTVIIDGYEWTGALLIETKYRNGNSIPNVTDDTAWQALTTGALCYYNNDVTNAYTTGGTSTLNVYNHNLVKFKDNSSVTWTKTQIDSNTINLEATISATGTVTSVTGTSPISSTGGATPAISISQANTSTSGYISSTDWNTFNGKQAALSGTGFVKSTSGTISYDTSSYYLASNPSGYTNNTGTVTSVGVSMPSAFSVASSPITTSGTIAVTGAGSTSQYIRGDGSLATYNPGGGGGGSSQVFYFNGGVASSVTGYKQMSTTANTGASTDFSVSANGYIASFLTDSASPSQLSIPAGNWDFKIYFNASSSGGSPSFYVELYKYNGSTFTLISSSSANPEGITNGTTVDLYITALAVPATTLLITDRLAVRVYVLNSGRTITMHTQDSNLSEVITTFSTGITALNGLTTQIQNFAVGTGGTDFAISSVTDTHTFNLPTASTANRGALSSTDWTTFNGKEPAIATGTTAQYYRGDKTFQTLNTAAVPELTNLYYTDARARSAVSLTTTGSSGASTYSSSTGVLNVPTYTLSGLGGVPTSRQLTINGTAYDLSTDRSWSVGTVTSVSALTLGTTGTDLSSTVATGTTTPVITLNIPTASSLNRGALSNTDWVTFSTKQNALGGSGIVKSTLGTISYISGTSSQFVKGDGSLDSSTYLTTTSAATTYVPYTGATGSVNLGANNITATSHIKSGGTSAQILAADGSVITAGTNVTISGGTISATGGSSSPPVGDTLYLYNYWGGFLNY